jgi:pre-rRNA-processing protein TSR4
MTTLGSSNGQILLGFVGSPLTKEVLSDPFISKIGGVPVPLQKDILVPEQICNSCNKTMLLIAQIYAPLDHVAAYERVLYIFGCNMPKCARSFSVLRCQVPSDYFTEHYDRSHLNSTKKNQQKNNKNDETVHSEKADIAEPHHDDTEVSRCQTQTPNQSTQNQTFTSPITIYPSDSDVFDIGSIWNSVDWGLGTQGKGQNTSRMSSEFSVKSLTTNLSPQLHTNSQHEKNKKLKKNKRTAQVAKAGTFVPYEIEFDNEPQEITEDSHVKSLLQQYYSEEKQNTSHEQWNESYERTVYKYDKTLYKFQKRLQRAPQQCIRYCFGGTPLWMSSSQLPKSIPNCEECGASRVFELQLLSTLVYFLKVSHHESRTIDFGVLAIYTCSKSCQSAQIYHKEFCFVQSGL